MRRSGRGFGTSRFLFLLGLACSSALVLRLPLGFTVSDVLFAAAFLVAVAGVLVSGRVPLAGVPAGIVAGIGMLSVGSVISSVLRGEPEDVLPVVGRLIFLAGPWLWMCGILLRRTENVTLAIRAWCASMAIGGIAAIAQYFAPDVVPGTAPIHGRMTGLTLHPNDLGASCGIALIPALGLLVDERDRALARVSNAVLCLLITVGVVASGSIAALSQVVVSIAAWAMMRGWVSVRQVWWIGIAIAVAFGTDRALDAAGQGAPSARLFVQVFSSEGPGTSQRRIEGFEDALEQIGEHPWVGTGRGLEGMTDASGSLIHNSYLGVWVDAGVLGILGLAVFSISVATLAARQSREDRRRRDPLPGCVLAAACLGVFVHMWASPILFQRYAWVPLGLSVAVSAIRRAQLASVRREPSREILVNRISLAGRLGFSVSDPGRARE